MKADEILLIANALRENGYAVSYIKTGDVEVSLVDLKAQAQAAGPVEFSRGGRQEPSRDDLETLANRWGRQ